ncbi:probable receptor-like serine/threonine-protein kinase At5g57670 [Oryza brachyantha]|uniref:Protein kinase domain-containing protein n=1 Tax=Oryza brachyantha TaxID=4533 RepID=J3M261_ORYBR|nr:probable receptor-like serine/threonine-protein kinase At5g57670 [Oryza brachyantha]
MNYLKRSRSLKRLLSLGRRSSNSDESNDECGVDVEPPPPPTPNKPTWRCFSYEEVDRATNGFHRDNMVGRGGYGEVYRGVLEDGSAVAVKRLAPTAAADEKKEKDFLTELGTVGHVRHRNVTALLGCCVDRGLHLIFEFSARGSVSANLHDEKLPAMAWRQRHGIAVGTARGLRYLHKGCARRIIHRDIKASNILLTADYEPQISDFGLARWLPSEWTHHAIAPIEGTFGCLAPEYFTHGIVDEKTDVFAFGVFLLELISGRKPVDGSHKSLIAWAKPYLNDGVAQGLVDPRLGDGYDGAQLRRLMFVASLCVRPAAAWRPTMTQVLELLESGEISQDQWLMPEEEEEEDEFWDFDDLDDFEDDDDDDDDDNYDNDDESDSPSISSSACSIHAND